MTMVDDWVAVVMGQFDGNAFAHPGPLSTNPATRADFEKRVRAALQETWASQVGPAKDWIDGAKAIRWGTWRWPAEVLREAQAWGDRNCCRFILVAELPDTGGMVQKLESVDQYELTLYIAPKPNRRETGLCARSIENRDRHAGDFESFLEGLLVGRGLILPGAGLR